jgi:hypothetical protein
VDNNRQIASFFKIFEVSDPLLFFRSRHDFYKTV